LICIRACLYAGTHMFAITLTYVLRDTAFRFPQGSAHARAWSRDCGTSGRTGPGPRPALWRAAAKSISGQHIFKYIGIYVCILLVAVDPAVRQFQVCANALARGGEILFRIIWTSIFVYIYIHTH